MMPSDTQTLSRRTRNPIAALLRRAGAPAGRRPIDDIPEAFERLEDRALLAGDEPGLMQVINGASPVAITLDVNGVGATTPGGGMSTIAPSGDDDVFSFVAPANDFVRIWADTKTPNSALDSRVEVYTPATVGSGMPLFSGSSQGPLTGGTLTDGWTGFVAQAGQTYYVRVLSDQLAGPNSTGDYVLRVNAKSTAFPALNAGNGTGSAAGMITRVGEDVVYKLTEGTQAAFNSLLTITAQAVPADLDPRLDIYDASGTRIAFDDDSGAQTDSFTAFKGAPNAVYYIRVRSDRFGNPAQQPSTGAYTLKVDGIATNVPLDPVTRLGSYHGNVQPTQEDSELTQFKSQGTGLAFITITPPPPVFGGMPDSAIHIYDDTGAQIGFNELPGPDSQLLINLTGGRIYYLVVENFDGTAGGTYVMDIESNATFNNQIGTEVDDHVNTPAGFDPMTPPAFGTPQYLALQRQFELATPIIWGAPQEVPPPLGPIGGALSPPVPDASADHPLVVIGEATGRIFDASGVGDTDLFQFVPPVDMLGGFAGASNMMMPVDNWQTNYRPAESLQIFSFGETFQDSEIRIFDSNFHQIYPQQGKNDFVLTGLGSDPAGVLDPASFPPTLSPLAYPYGYAQGQPIHLDIWGGEVYYLEVSGKGDGRYDLSVQVDAAVDGNPLGSASPTSASQFYHTPALEGDFADAGEIQIDPNTGEGNNFASADTDGLLVPPPAAGPPFTAVLNNTNETWRGRAYAGNLVLPTPPPAGMGATVDQFVGDPGSRGRVIFQISDLGQITSPTDTNLFQFRALYTGTAEVRLSTTQITDTYFEQEVQTEDGDPMTPPMFNSAVTKRKTYNSPLDGALRIFNNDQQQIAYNNDNTVTPTDYSTEPVGAYTAVFNRLDPRAVFPVESGKIYYIQVESGQRQNFTLTYPKTDWRHATGSYELLVNSMPNLGFTDDHIDGTVDPQATPIPTNVDLTSTTAILGQVSGVIMDHPGGFADADLFQFISPSTGTAKITVSIPQGAPGFNRKISVFNAGNQLVGTVLANGTSDAVVNVLANQGERYFVRVEGQNPAGQTTHDQGAYVVKLSGVPKQDDNPSVADFFDATIIPKDTYDYDKTESILGKIESLGDNDIYSFQSIAYDTPTITVTSLTPNFRTSVRVFEISTDPAGNPVILQVAHNEATTGTDSQVTFPVTAPPRTSGANHDTFNDYYILVSGTDPAQDSGDYRLTLDFNVATDDHPDAGQFALATPITLDPSTGAGSAAPSPSHIEVTGDTDLFQITTLAGGLTTATLTSPTGSLLLPRIRVFDQDHNPVAVAGSMGTTQVTGPDADVSTAVFQFSAVRGQTYYLQVEGVTSAGNMHKTADTGAYTLDVLGVIPDDHPNEGEFPIADQITLSSFTGDGSAFGTLEYGTDSDLFTFTELPNISGLMRITIDTPTSDVHPVLRLFASDTSEIGSPVTDGGTGDENPLDGVVTRSISITAGTKYYLLVSSDQGQPVTTGDYVVSLDGQAPPPGPDDYPDAGDWTQAAQIRLNTLDGDGSISGHIEVATDSDLFFFNSLSGSTTTPRPAFVNVYTANGSPLHTGVRIYKETSPGVFTPIASDSAGGPGVNSGVQFDIDAPNTRYFVEVDGNGGTGAYTVKVDTQPPTFFLYYPEGFANSAIREYVTLGNQNNFAVNYTIRLRYESNDPETVITGVVPAHSRGGITVSDGTNNPGSGVLFNKPYAIVVESDGFLGANISHYDFGNTLGQVFSGQTSATWSFAQGEKFHGQAADFLLYYNPNPTDVIVTLTAYQTNPATHVVTTVAFSQTVHGFHRLGWNFDQTAQLPVGKFSFVITAAPVNPSDPFVGIVAALSHNDLANSAGDAVLGDPNGGATSGVVPGVSAGTNVIPTVTLFNTSSTPATINLVGKYIDNAFPAIIKSYSLAPFESKALSAADLGMVPGEVIGLRYDANTPITLLSSTLQNGDSDATQANTEAAKSFYFSDAFINRKKAGSLYFEDMYFYNPDVNPLTVTLNFVFNDGTTSQALVNVGAKDFTIVALHQLQAAIGQHVFNWFAVNATAPTPFAATMTHYDLVLAGGWGTQGAPYGLTVPIANI